MSDWEYNLALSYMKLYQEAYAKGDAASMKVIEDSVRKLDEKCAARSALNIGGGFDAYFRPAPLPDPNAIPELRKANESTIGLVPVNYGDKKIKLNAGYPKYPSGNDHNGLDFGVIEDDNLYASFCGKIAMQVSISYYNGNLYIYDYGYHIAQAVLIDGETYSVIYGHLESFTQTYTAELEDQLKEWLRNNIGIKDDFQIAKLVSSMIVNTFIYDNSAIRGNGITKTFELSTGYANAGDIMGTIGNTGYSSGQHLHFAVKNSKGHYLNPYGFLPTMPRMKNDTGWFDPLK